MFITAQGCCLRNDLYCVEWDVKLYYTIPYHTILFYTFVPVRSLYSKFLNTSVFCSVQITVELFSLHWIQMTNYFLKVSFKLSLSSGVYDAPVTLSTCLLSKLVFVKHALSQLPGMVMIILYFWKIVKLFWSLVTGRDFHCWCHVAVFYFILWHCAFSRRFWEIWQLIVCHHVTIIIC